MHTTPRRIAMPATLGLGVLLAVAACGGTPPPAAPTGQSGGAATVAVRSVGGQQVLVDRAGAALYSNDQDSPTHLRCVTSDCTAIWAPLTVSGRPTAAAGVTGTVGTVRRPDGSEQVTLDGKPLYTFSFDQGAGRVTGNGARDSFAGTNFTWHSATASGRSTSSSAPAPGYGGGY